MKPDITFLLHDLRIDSFGEHYEFIFLDKVITSTSPIIIYDTENTLHNYIPGVNVTINMKKQTNEQLDLFSGPSLRDEGINKAMISANNKSPKWTQEAYDFLLKFIKSNTEFMAEDVRSASEGTIDQPPSNRAWGGILVRAVKSGLIKRKGFKNVKNAKAHCTPATLWEVIN